MMTSGIPISVAILTNASAPYRTPFFNELAERCRLLVVFETLREPDREWATDTKNFRFEYTFSKALSIPRPRARKGFVEQRVLRVPLNAISVLNRFDPDVVVSDELGPRTASAATFCRLRRRPLVIWWEGTPHTESETSSTTSFLRKKLLRHATRAWGNGKGSASSLTSYGFADTDIDLGMTGMDTVRWMIDVNAQRAAARDSIRERLSLKGTVLLFVGSLKPRKGIHEFLASLSLLSTNADLPAWSLLVVGSGPLEREVSEWSRLHPTIPVASVGFVQPTDLAQYYAAADVFVMPSLEDCWGLVCLESLVAGLPQVTSSLVGAAADLITSDEIGNVVDPGNVQEMAQYVADRIRSSSTMVPEAVRELTASTWSATSMAERAMVSIRSAAGEHA